MKNDKISSTISDEKYCPKCGQHRSKKEFGKDMGRKDRLDHYCRSCRAKLARERYRNNPDSAARKDAARNAKRLRVTDIIRAFALLEGCAITGSKESLVFHHLDPDTKLFGLNKAYERSWNDILGELEKCVVVNNRIHGKIHSALKGHKVKDPTPEFIEFMKKHYDLDIEPDDKVPELEVVDDEPDDGREKAA